MRRMLPLVCLLPALAALPALAGSNDALHPFFAVSYSHEDNLLRVTDGQPAFDNTLGDSSRSTLVGFNFDKTYGRQRLYAEAKLTKVAFGHFTQLDYDGKDFLGRWTWQLGNDWSGNLSSSYDQILAPYTDLRSSERNLRIQKRNAGDVTWRLGGHWRLRGAAVSDKYEYDLLSQRYNNRTEKLNELGLDYYSGTGSSIGLVTRKITGTYLNKRPYNGLLIDDGFTQDEVKANINWVASGLTSVSFLGGWASRSHVFFGDRDSKGANGRLTVRYLPRATVQLTTAFWREYTALESAYVSYSLNNGANVAANWYASEKVQFTSSYNRERRSYTPSVAVTGPSDFSDILATGSLGLTYLPIRTLQLAMSTYHQTRSGIAALGTGGYKANGVTVSATAQF
ncbi:MAG: XrtB/PEP-CTERM-associated polysaccharide biosynthesis outer membrane protein EpsL [Pseudomonadota bacterium]